MGSARLSQSDLLPRGRQRRPLRRVGAAGAVQRRTAGRVQIASISGRHSLMRAKNLLIGGVLAIAIGAPIVGFVGDINMAQPTDGERTAFFHGPSSGPVAVQSGLASLDRASD